MKFNSLLIALNMAMGGTAMAAEPEITLTSTDTAVCQGQPLGLWIQAETNIPASFQWQKDGLDLAGETAPSLLINSAQFSDEGAYWCIVTNVDGDDTSKVFDVNVMASPVAEFAVLSTCQDDSLMVADISNIAVGTYTSVWTFEDGRTFNDVSPFDQALFGPEPNAGQFELNLELTSDSGCVDTYSVVYTVSAKTTFNLDIEDASCWGEESGEVTFIPADNEGWPYVYQIDQALHIDSIINGLAAGDYTASLINIDGCVMEQDFTISQPEKLKGKIDKLVEPSCTGLEDAWVDMSASGGTGNYNFSACCGLYTSDTLLVNLAAGQHSIIVRDVNSCTAQLSIFINDPDSIGLDYVLTPPSCSGLTDAVLDINAWGGSGDLMIDFDGGLGNDTLWNNFGAGDYLITVLDENDCELEIEVEVDEPNALIIDQVLTTNAVCGDSTTGALSIMASGGTGLLTYDMKLRNGDYENEQDSGTYANLAPGKYDVMVGDENMCGAEQPVTIFMTSPALTIDSTTVTHPACQSDSSGSIVLFVSDTSARVWMGDWLMDSLDFTVENATEGGYDFTLRNAFGCEASTSITLNAISALSIVTDSVTSSYCSTDSSGMVWVSSNGGMGSSVTYGVDKSSNQTGAFSNVPAGTIDIWVEDSLCRMTDKIEVGADNDLPTADFLITTTEGAAAFLNLSTDADSYFWEFGDETTSEETNPIHNYPIKNIIYKAKLIATNECGNDTLEQYVELGTASIFDLNPLQTGLSLYPNPSAGAVQFGQYITPGSEVVVFDALGQAVMSTLADEAQSIELQGLANGLYKVVVPGVGAATVVLAR